MNFFNRALKYCWRQRLRSLLLLLTFTLLSTTVLIAISSEKAVEQGTKQAYNIFQRIARCPC
jgi:putative ABC transport system permease protein